MITGNKAAGGGGGEGGTGGLAGTFFSGFRHYYFPRNLPGGVGGTGGIGGSGDGGAIYLDGGNLTVSGGTISGNSAVGVQVAREDRAATVVSYSIPAASAGSAARAAPATAAESTWPRATSHSTAVPT